MSTLPIWVPVEQADVSQMSREKQYEVTTTQGVVCVMRGSDLRKDKIVALREYNPEPYVPPKPKRMTCMVAGMDMREVLPGDPDPDRVLEVIKSLREQGCHNWADKLEGRS